MKNTAILFWDFDNTLAYRDGMWTSCLHELLAEYGISHIAKETISPPMHAFPWQKPEVSHKELFQGKLWWEFMQDRLTAILMNLEISQAMSSGIVKQFRSRYLNIQYWHVFNDTINVLEKAQFIGFSNYILSNHTPELSMLTDGLGISKYFMEIYSSALIGYDKPNNQIFQYALGRVPSDQQKVMIGDNYSADILGACNNGIPGVLVRSANKEKYNYYSAGLENVLDIVSLILNQKIKSIIRPWILA